MEGGPIDVLLPVACKACCLGPFSKGDALSRSSNQKSAMIDRVARITTLFMGDTDSAPTFVLRAMEIERDMLLH